MSPRSGCGHAEQPVQEMAFTLVMKISDQLVSRSRWLNEVNAVRFRLEETGGKIAHDIKSPYLVSLM